MIVPQGLGDDGRGDIRTLRNDVVAAVARRLQQQTQLLLSGQAFLSSYSLSNQDLKDAVDR